MRKHDIMFHLYADDTQLYISFKVDECTGAFDKMEQCINDIRLWMANSFLKLNDSKTEVLLIGTKSKLKQLPNLALHIGDDSIAPSEVVRNIGAMFDSTLSMKHHVATICKGAWYHLNLIGQIRQYIDADCAKTLMHSFVSSRLDNFNSLLYGIPKQEILKLQRVQNAAARIVTKTRKFDHITPILHQLHWLPIAQRIDFKILLLTFKALHNLAPSYITNMLKKVDTYSNRNHRSSSSNLLIIPTTSLVSFGDRCFSFAAPKLWNDLPCECRAAKTLTSFKSLVKTYLFKKAFLDM